MGRRVVFLIYFVSSRPENLGARSHFRPAAPRMEFCGKVAVLYAARLPCRYYQARAQGGGLAASRAAAQPMEPDSVGPVTLQCSQAQTRWAQKYPRKPRPLCLWTCSGIGGGSHLCSFPLILVCLLDGWPRARLGLHTGSPRRPLSSLHVSSRPWSLTVVSLERPDQTGNRKEIATLVLRGNSESPL